VKFSNIFPEALLQDGALPQTREVCILVSDLRGFTALLESFPPLLVVDLLNHYFRVMAGIIASHGGTIDKFMGDAIMALFPTAQDAAAPLRLLDCAIDMQLAMDDINLYAAQLQLPDIFMGIGINHGSVIACNLGSEIYRELTVVGGQVNLASRLAAHCLRGQVLMSANLHALLKDVVVTGRVGELHFKGKAEALQVYEVLGQCGERERRLPIRDNRRSLRVEAALPATYATIRNNEVGEQMWRGQVLDLSQHGLRLLTTTQHAYLEELRLVLPFLDADKPDVYARVVGCKQESVEHWSVNLEFTSLDEGSSHALIRFISQRL